MAVTTSSKIMSAGSKEFGQVAPTVPSGIFFHSPIAVAVALVPCVPYSVSSITLSAHADAVVRNPER